MSYSANQPTEAFEVFLQDFKTSPEQTITTALGNITINEDELDDDYDFMDEDEEAGERRRQEKESRREPQYKYKDMLQQLADRTIDEMTIDLDDLVKVLDLNPNPSGLIANRL
jgi:DNA replication licensing factor MCM7